MAVAMKGLRVKPAYEDLVGVAVSDELYNVKDSCNRDATFLRNCFVLKSIRWRRYEGDGKTARTVE